MLQAAFYKAPGTWRDKFIRWRTNSIYSHVELVVNGISYSSSVRDFGVRSKPIEFKPDRWDVYDVNSQILHESSVLSLMEQTRGAKYDFLGAMVGHLIGIPKIQDKNKYSCSEWCALALGFDNSYKYTPGSLFNMLNIMGVLKKTTTKQE